MHAHDKFHNSNKDLVGMLKSAGRKESEKINYDEEVVIEEPGKSKFGPDGKTGDETSQSSKSHLTRTMPTKFKIDRAKLNSLITAMNRNNGDDSQGDGEGCVRIRNFFLADVRHET